MACKLPRRSNARDSAGGMQQSSGRRARARGGAREGNPVQVAEVEKGSLSQQNEIIGTANPSRSVDIIPKLNGELVRLNVKKGDMVSKGATLGTIDADDLEVQLKLEQFSLEQAQDQYKTLHNAQASDLELDQAKRGIEQAQLRVKQASSRVADATLRAPMSGQVIRVEAEAGEFVSSTSPLFTIVSTNPVKFSANVSANQMLLLQNRKETKVEVPDVGKSFTARITYLSPSPMKADSTPWRRRPTMRRARSSPA